MALLILRSIPVDENLLSPAEMLNMRQMKSNLPMKIPNQRQDKDTIAKRHIERQQQQKLYHNHKGTTRLALLDPGQSVHIQHPASGKWHPATVVYTRQEPRSYNVQQANGTTFWRNRHQIRETREKFANVEPTQVLCTNPTPAIVEHSPAGKIHR